MSVNTTMDWVQVVMVIVLASTFIKGWFTKVWEEDEMRARYENE